MLMVDGSLRMVNEGIQSEALLNKGVHLKTRQI
jgi:hypothetical protein